MARAWLLLLVLSDVLIDIEAGVAGSSGRVMDETAGVAIQ
jgi:hypothetical protein